MTETTNKSARKRQMARDPKPHTAGTPEGAPTSADAGETAPEPPSVPLEKKQTKIALVLGLLSRPEGATLDQLVTATGWQSHTTRAALTGLKKKGHTIERRSVADRTTYFRV